MDKQTESLIEDIRDGAYKLGQIVQLELMGKQYIEQSGKLFGTGKDELANIFRKEGNEMLDSAKILRTSYETNEKKLADNSWSILENCIGNIIYPE